MRHKRATYYGGRDPARVLDRKRLHRGHGLGLEREAIECAVLHSGQTLDLLLTSPKLPQLKSSKLLIRLADWKIVAVRYWLHFDGDIEE